MFTGIRHLAHMLTVPPAKACLLCEPGPVYIYIGHACRHLPSAVPWISKDRLLRKVSRKLKILNSVGLLNLLLFLFTLNTAKDMLNTDNTV